MTQRKLVTGNFMFLIIYVVLDFFISLRIYPLHDYMLAIQVLSIYFFVILIQFIICTYILSYLDPIVAHVKNVSGAFCIFISEHLILDGIWLQMR